MKYTITEKKALKKLGIPDFKHMTKDKIAKFTSMLPYMDKDVALKAIDQFPLFKDFATDIVNILKEVANKVIELDDKNQQGCINICNMIVESLSNELKQENLTNEDRKRIEEEMIEVARMLGEQLKESRKFKLKILAFCMFMGISVTAIVATMLGSNTQLSSTDSDIMDNDDV